MSSSQYTQPGKGGMSKDRVHFFFPGSGYLSVQPQDEAAAKAFRIPVSHAMGARKRGLEIICRPSQFARFLIYRNEMGGANDFKGLQARIVTQEVLPERVDVSLNRA